MRQTDWLYAYALVRLPGYRTNRSGARSTHLAGFVSYRRDGDLPRFEVTDELKAAWKMGAWSDPPRNGPHRSRAGVRQQGDDSRVTVVWPREGSAMTTESVAVLFTDMVDSTAMA